MFINKFCIYNWNFSPFPLSQPIVCLNILKKSLPALHNCHPVCLLHALPVILCMLLWDNNWQAQVTRVPYYPGRDVDNQASRSRTISSGSDDSGTSVDPLDSDYDIGQKVCWCFLFFFSKVKIILANINLKIKICTVPLVLLLIIRSLF